MSASGFTACDGESSPDWRGPAHGQAQLGRVRAQFLTVHGRARDCPHGQPSTIVTSLGEFQ